MVRNSQPAGRRSPAPRSNPALIPGLIALVMIAIAVGVAVMTKKPKVAVESTAPKASPFSDMPPEAVPPPRPKQAGSDLPPAPESISSEPLWVAAQAIAAEGLVLYDEAMKAKAKGDQSLANEKGKAAREKLDEAITNTADWEESILAQYNAYDAKVSAIKNMRTDWFNKLRYLNKSVGH